MGAAEDYAAKAKAFREQNWQNGGTTVTATTEGQNLAAVANQPGNTSGATAQPYITPQGTTDYHITGGSYSAPTVPNRVEPPSTGMSGVSTTIPSQTAQPVSAQQSQPTQAAPDYAALAAARTAAALQQKKTIAEQQKASLDRSYARSNQITQDNRTLENGRIDRTLNPFSGKTAFDKGIIGRERALVDETSAGNLQAQKSNIDQLLADYENATADEQVRIADELQRADRAYNLDLAKFNQDQSNFDKNFNYNSGQDSIKNGQNQQVIDYNQDPNNPNNYGQSLTNQLNELKIGNYSTEQKQQAQLFEQELKSGKMSNEAAAYNLKELTDPNSATNQSKKLDLQIKALEAKNLPEKLRLELQGLKKSNDQIGVVHYKPQTQAEKDVDQLQIRKLTAEVTKLENPTDKPAPAPKSTDYKLNPKFSEDIAYIKANPAAASMLDTEAQKFIDAYGYDGYKEMRSAAGLD